MSENKEVLPQLPDIVGRTNWLPFRKAGKLIFLSGICGIKDDGSTCDDPKEQIKIAYDNFENTLREAGVGPENVVMFNQYIGDDKYYSKCLNFRNVFFGENLPACNDIVVTLGHPSHIVELQCIVYKDD